MGTDVVDEVAVIEKSRDNWKKIYEKISVVNIFESGGVIADSEYIPSLFKFANYRA